MQHGLYFDILNIERHLEDLGSKGHTVRICKAWFVSQLKTFWFHRVQNSSVDIGSRLIHPPCNCPTDASPIISKRSYFLI